MLEHLYFCTVWLWAKFRIVSNWFENGLEIKEKKQTKEKKRKLFPTCFWPEKTQLPPSPRPTSQHSRKPSPLSRSKLPQQPNTRPLPPLLSLTRGPDPWSRWRSGPTGQRRSLPFLPSSPGRPWVGLFPMATDLVFLGISGASRLLPSYKAQVSSPHALLLSISRRKPPQTPGPSFGSHREEKNPPPLFELSAAPGSPRIGRRASVWGYEVAQIFPLLTIAL